jgi:BirA family biotin operon repressor/biotin-[acetyl-CoA-carboxylase] ligase
MIQIGKNIIRLPQTDSTNSFASRLLDNSRPEEGTAIVAGFQNMGRGQRQSNWESERDKNLIVSFIFYPMLNVSDYFLLNQVIALSVHETIKKEFIQNVKIKWPNDIMVNDNKIAGILIENSIRGNSVIVSIAGLGINVNQVTFQKYEPPATSFYLETQKQYVLTGLFEKLCISLNKWYLALNDEDHEIITDSYCKALYRLNETHSYQLKNKKVKGVIRGVSHDGRLLLKTELGNFYELNFKEIKYLF